MLVIMVMMMMTILVMIMMMITTERSPLEDNGSRQMIANGLSVGATLDSVNGDDGDDCDNDDGDEGETIGWSQYISHFFQRQSSTGSRTSEHKK